MPWLAWMDLCVSIDNSQEGAADLVPAAQAQDDCHPLGISYLGQVLFELACPGKEQAALGEQDDHLAVW